ncbi:hypothetical protein [Arboricoccus pini]|uniref:hypothetical protein n=1 Tax=Arboricoccus pini TaxID=1963835 RepID=UPI001FB04061|nr:hypothetical protein [Arboricoccus pini]
MPEPSGQSNKKADPAFERWLGKQLHGLYDPVLNEAVPDEIARLIEGFREREPAKKDGQKD